MHEDFLSPVAQSCKVDFTFGFFFAFLWVSLPYLGLPESILLMVLCSPYKNIGFEQNQ